MDITFTDSGIAMAGTVRMRNRLREAGKITETHKTML